MAIIRDPAGVDYRFRPPKWCRHKDQFLTYTQPGASTWSVSCSNCNATGVGATKGAAHDGIMAVEAVGAVTEVPAP